jgi:hypothetical protein
MQAGALGARCTAIYLVAMGGWSAAALWARRHARRRWRSLLVLGLLAGLTASLAMAAAAGARRTSTALARLETQTRASDAIVFTSQVHDFNPQWDRLAHRPEVAALVRWDLLWGDVAGQPGGVFFVSDDGRWGTVVDKPIVVQGRMWSPHADEIVIEEQFAAAAHVRVGDVVPFHAYGPDQPGTSGTPDGATVALRVVGIVRDAKGFLFVPGGIVSPGVLQHHRDQMFVGQNAMVRLTGGSGGIDALRRDATADVAPGVPVLDLHSTGRRITTTLRVESFTLWVLVAAIALAGGLLVLQVLSRSVSLIGDDVRSLRALGLTRGDVVAASAVAHAVAVASAAAIGVFGAFALSPLLPVGEGRQVDPDPGLHADWTVLGIGLVVSVTALLVATLAMTLATMRRDVRSDLVRRSAFTAWLRRVAPLPVSLGASAAFERAPGARGTPVRPALVGAVAGVLGVVAALTLDHGITHALDNPQLAGVTWAASVSPPPQDLTRTFVSPALVEQVQRATPGASMAFVRRDLVEVNGVGVPTFSVLDTSRRAGPITLAVVSGRAPRAPDEAAIGPVTATLLHVRVGDWVRVGYGVREHLVGEALFPSDVHAEFDEGLWLLPSAFNALVPPHDPTQATDDVIAVRFPDSGNQEASALAAAEASQKDLPSPPSPIGHLMAALGGPHGDLPLGQAVQPASIPEELTNLENVAQLPTVLSIFLALLAVAALSFVLVTSSRARRVELAVLRAMGLGVGASRLMVYWQATAISIVGLVVGIPLGIVVGRWAWSEVAARVPLVDVPPLALAVVGLAIPVALTLANAVATVPARRLTSLRPAEALRAE